MREIHDRQTVASDCNRLTVAPRRLTRTSLRYCVALVLRGVGSLRGEIVKKPANERKWHAFFIGKRDRRKKIHMVEVRFG